MTSKLIVNSIRHTGASADAITMDASGNVTFPANATCSGTSTGFGFTPEADGYRLTTDFSSSADPITSNWERNDSAWEGTGYLGSSLITQASGIWTFAKTGWYYFYLQHDAQIGGGNSDGFNQFFASISTNSGGAYTNFCENDGWFGDNASSKYMVKSSSALIKVADASTYRIKITQSAGSSATTTKGSSSNLRTGFILLRIGDA